MKNSVFAPSGSRVLRPRYSSAMASCALPLLLMLVLSLSFASGSAHAQCILSSPTTWNIVGNGNWSTDGDWNPATYPNLSSTNACITNGTSTVTLDTNASIANLQLAGGNTLNFSQGTSLTLSGTSFANAGQTVINGGGGFNTFLFLNNNVTLSGGGTVTMNVAGGGGSTLIEQGVGGVTLTNADNTIQGAGVIGNGGLALSNAGIINANSSGQGLLLNGSGGITNTNLLEATSGGYLQVESTTVNNAGGNITANGGTVQLFGSTVIQGGTLNTLNGGVLGTPSGFVATLDGSTNGALTLSTGSTYTSDFNTITYLLGTINNQGNIQLNGGGGTNTFLILSADTTLQGGGTVTLSTAGGGGSTLIEQGVGGLTLTNANNTIQGAGVIGNGGLALSNAGIINANSSGQGLLLDGSGGITNTNLLEATSGGYLQIESTTVNNAGGNITANGGTVQLFGGAVIQGGTLNTLGGGVLGTPSGNVATLDGSTGAGAITINGTYTGDLGSETLVLGTINNMGNIQLNGGGGTNTYLILNADTTLQGGGTVTLSTAGGGGFAIIEQAVGGLTLTNVNNTIQGNGIIGQNGLALVNQASGTINANVSGQALLLDSGPITNAGLLEATNSGILQFSNTTVNNSGANITANGGTVQFLTGTTIQGGTLNTLSGGVLGTPSGNLATLDGSTNGALTLSTGSTYTGDLGSNTYVLGTINNQGNIQLNGGSGNNTFLILNADTTLQGGGTVTLSTAGGGGQAFVEQAVGGLTLTNVNNTIQGNGIIGQNGLALVNQASGTIDANVSGQPLILGGGPVTNAGLLEATNNGILQINGDTVNNAGGNITANGAGATVQLFGSAVIQGGTLNTLSGGVLGTPSGNLATLDGSTGAGAVTINGTYTSDLNTITYLLGTINNQGNIQLNGGGGSNTQLIIDSGNVMLQGGGTVTLSTLTGGGQSFIDQAAGGFILTNVDNTIQGSGIIGQNGLTLVNEATINANSTGGGQVTYLLLQGLSGLTNTGLLEATNSGVLDINGVVVNNAGGNIAANGAGASVQLYGSTQIQGGTLTNNGGAFFGTPANSVATLDGATQGALTINGTYTSDFGSETFLLGTINNKNNFQLNGGGGFNSFLFIDSSNVTLQGGGTVTLSTLGGGGQAFIVQATGGLTLENVDNTIQGAGIIGQNGLSVTNDVGGTLLANAIGQTLLLSSTGTLTNNGTMEATAGGTMQVTMPLANFSGNTLTGGTYIVDGTSAASTMNLSLGSNAGGEIVNNAANIVLNGANANVTFIDANGNNLLSALAANTTAGSGLTIKNGYNLTTPGDFSNAGTVTVGTASTFSMGGGANSYTQSGGTTQGIGTIAGNVTLNGGTILPGGPNAPGTLTINGSYNQAAGSFSEQMIGASAGQFAVLNVTSGNLTLGAGAQLSISLLSGFNPVGNTYTILTDAGGLVSGTFANAPASGFQMDGVNWTIAYNSNNVILDAVSLVGTGLITATWNTTSGNWTVATQWSCTPGPANCVPSNGGGSSYTAVINSPSNTLTLDASETINNLTLTAGTLDIGVGKTLNLVNQPNGITDIAAGAGLTVAGTFEVNGTTSALAQLGSVEGTLTLVGQTTSVTPGSGTLTVSNTGNMNLQQGTQFSLTGNLSNSGTINTGNGVSDTGNNALNVSGTLTNSGTITLGGTGDSLSADLTNSGVINLSGNNDTLTDTGDFNNNGGSLNLSANLDSVSVAGNFNNNAGASLTMSGTNGSVSVTGAFNNSGGTVTLNGSADTLTAGSFTNSGTITVDQTETLAATGNFTNSSGGILTVNGGGASATAGGLVQTGGAFTNDSGGIVRVAGGSGGGPAGILNADGLFTNSGTVALTAPGGAPGGLLQAFGGFTNSGGAVTIDANSQLRVFNSHDYTQTGAGSTTVVSGTLTTSMLGSTGSISLTDGSIQVNSGGLVSSGSDITNNNGTISVASGGLVTMPGNYTQSGSGASTQVNGTLTAALATIQGGMLLGTGTINGNVSLNGGTMQPGGAALPGTLTINGNYNHAAGAFNELISSSGNGLLVVNGISTLASGALLNIDLLGGFTPTLGETFILMDFFSGSSGTFANAPTTGFQMDGFNWTIAYNYNANDIVLDAGSPVTPTPEPSSLFLLVAGLAGLSWQLQRKRSA